MLCRSLFVLLFFFWWLLCCLTFYLRILITPLVSSNSSYERLHVFSISYQTLKSFLCSLNCYLIKSFTFDLSKHHYVKVFNVLMTVIIYRTFHHEKEKVTFKHGYILFQPNWSSPVVLFRRILFLYLVNIRSYLVLQIVSMKYNHSIISSLFY